MGQIEVLSTKEQRALRRQATFRTEVRRRDEHIRAVHTRYWHDPSPENIDCVCEASHHYFAKRRAGGERWGKSIFGNPKYSRKWGLRRMAVEARIRSRRLARNLTSGRLDSDDVLPAKWFWRLV